jgi:hypothetical protein
MGVLGAEAFTKDTLRAMILGDAFETSVTIPVDASESPAPHTIKVAGTNGVVKRGRGATSDLSFGALFYNDGRFIVPQASDQAGKPLREPNTRVGAYNTTALTVMLEFLYEFSTTRRQGYRLVYALNGELQFTEADDANSLSFNAQLLCDTIDIDDFWIYGGNAVKMANATNYNHFIEVAQDEITIDATDGTIGIIGQPWTGDLPIPCVFYCPNGLQEVAGSEIIDEPSMVLSCDGGKTAVSRLLDLSITGGDSPATNARGYAFGIYDFDVTQGQFVVAIRPTGR